MAYADKLQKGETLFSDGYAIREGKTSPPKRYTSGSMVLAMENAGQLIEEEELREQIKGSGIGTSATRAEIIKKLVQLCEKYDKKLYGVVSNMNIAVSRRDLLQKFDCLICNQIEAGVFFSDDYSEKTPAEMEKILAERLKAANVPAMVVTMGGDGAVYAEADGESGFCPAQKVQVKDTTGAGDAFCAGVSAGLTYGKTLGQAVEIGTRLAASVITSSENVCPRFRPEEFGIEA